MKFFVIKITSFTFIIVFYFVLNTFINYTIFNKSKIPINNTKILISGDSHVQTSLNPKSFFSATNISQSAEPYIISFWKLKYIFKHNKPNILLLGFSHHNISAFNDNKFWDKKFSSEMFERSYIIGNYRSLENIKIDYQEYYKIFLREMCLYPHTKHFKFVGGYNNSYKSSISDLEQSINRHYYLHGKELGVSEIQIKYLYNIIKLCENHDVTLILVGSPVHTAYYKKIPSIIKKRYDEEKQRFQKNNLIIADFTETIYDDKFYLNSDHLNEQGALKFSKSIYNMLKSTILKR
jgi:hypothetical protein